MSSTSSTSGASTAGATAAAGAAAGGDNAPAGSTAGQGASASPPASSTPGEALSRTPTALGTLAAEPTQAEVLAQHPSITGAAQGLKDAGYSTLVDNPRLSIQWESTRSAWDGRVGFTPGMADVLDGQGLTINPDNLTPAPGSVGKSSGLTPAQANPRNGLAAEVAIESRLQGQGFETSRQVDVGNSRRVDVVGVRTHADPRLTERVEIESKAYRAGVTERNVSEAVRDGQRLAENVNLRSAGRVLEGVGRVARPVGMVLDAVQVGSAFRADGNRVGENTGRAVSSLAGSAAGGWGGATMGAAIGTAILPGVGTVVGGLIGGIGGALLGDMGGRSAFDAVRSWF